MGSYGRSERTLDGLRTFFEETVVLTLTVHEIKLGVKHNLQRVWIVIIFFFGFLFIMTERDLDAISALLIFFAFFGSIISVVLASATITAEVGGIADSLLSKSVRRWEYVLSKFLSQIALSLSVYFLMLGLTVLLLYSFDWFPNDINYRRLMVAISLVGLVLVFFSAIGVMFSSLATKSVFSILMSIVVWFLFIFMFLVVPQWDLIYSPVTIISNFYPIVESTWAIDWLKLFAFYLVSPLVFFVASLSIFYQRDL
jgi:ABC-type transport system involved in multi-copper enzyme maturation permease subunit